MRIAMWFWAIIVSAVALGVYDLCKKYSLRENQVMPVLFFGTLSGTVFYVAILGLFGDVRTAAQCDFRIFFALLLKTVLVSGSWICAYYALRALPISIVAPIRATSPFWTLCGALALYHEFPNFQQALGMMLIFGGYYCFSILGKKENISFVRNKGIHLVILATVLGAASTLYDKFLLNIWAIPRNTVQFYFSVDGVLVLGLAWWIQRRWGRRECFHFQWRWTIPLIGILLITADYLYFYAVSVPDIHISILSILRRCSCFVSFFTGVVLFHERNIWKKAVALLTIFFGVVLLALAS